MANGQRFCLRIALLQKNDKMRAVVLYIFIIRYHKDQNKFRFSESAIFCSEDPIVLNLLLVLPDPVLYLLPVNGCYMCQVRQKESASFGLISSRRPRRRSNCAQELYRRALLNPSPWSSPTNRPSVKCRHQSSRPLLQAPASTLISSRSHVESVNSLVKSSAF